MDVYFIEVIVPLENYMYDFIALRVPDTKIILSLELYEHNKELQVIDYTDTFWKDVGVNTKMTKLGPL